MYRVLTAIIITLLLALFVSQANADSLELIGPGLTFHVIEGNAGALFSNKVTSDGRLLYTPQLAIKGTQYNDFIYSSLTAFTAQNSIGKLVYGGMGAIGLALTDYLNTGIILGGYVQNNEDFRYLNITPFSLTGGTNAIVPLLGFEVNFKLNLTDRTFLGFNNIVTPIISNHSLSIGVNFD